MNPETISTGISAEPQAQQPSADSPAPLQVGSAIPTGATIGDNSGLAIGSAIPQGATIGEQQPSQTGLQSAISDVKGTNEVNPSWQSPVLGGIVSGAVKSAANAAGGIIDMLTNKGKQYVPPGGMKILAAEYKMIHPEATPEQVTDVLNKVANGSAPFSKQTQEAASWLHSGGQPDGFWEQVGSIGEQMLEWMGGEGALKLASAPIKAAEAGKTVEAVDTVGHVANAQQITKIMKANPKLAGVVALGLKAAQDAVGVGGQNYVHNENAGNAVKAGLIAAPISGAAQGVSAGLEGLANEFEKVGPTNLETNIPKQEGPTHIFKGAQEAAGESGNNVIPQAATHPENVENLSPIGETVKGYSTKKGAQNFINETVQPAAQKALQDNFANNAVDYVNQLRDIRGENPHTEPPILKTLDGTAKFMQNEAKKTYQKLDDVAQHDIDEWTNKYGKQAQKEEVKEGTKDFASKLDEYGKPSSETVSNKPAITEIPPKPKLFTELQDQINDAKDTIKSKGSSQVDKQTAIENLPEYEKEMKNFMDSHSNVVGDDELQAANQVYSQGKRYDYLAKELRSATKGAQGGGPFKGDQLTIRPQALENLERGYDNKFGEGSFKKLLGSKAYDNFNTVVNTLKTPETGSKFTEWLNNLPLHAGKIFTIPVGAFADRLLFDPEITSQIISKFKGASQIASKTGTNAAKIVGTQVRPNPLKDAMQATQSQLQ